MSATYSLHGTNVDDVAVPAIGFGTWPATGDVAYDAVRSALEVGYRHIDTAQKYENEDMVGTAIRESEVDRDQIFVTSKLVNQYFGSASNVRAGIEKSLATMKLNYIDLMLIHWPNPKLGNYVETASSLAAMVDSGVIRAWGVSNFKPEQLQNLLDEGLVPPINQVELSPTVQQPAVQAADDAAEVLTGAYSPLGRDTNLYEILELVELAERYGKSAQQIVLRWHLDEGRLPVPRSLSMAHQESNLDVFDFSLTEDERAAIRGLDTGAGPRLDSDEYGH